MGYHLRRIEKPGIATLLDSVCYQHLPFLLATTYDMIQLNIGHLAPEHIPVHSTEYSSLYGGQGEKGEGATKRLFNQNGRLFTYVLGYSHK